MLNEDPTMVIGDLLANKYIWNFVPSELKTIVPKNLANPLLTCYVTARVVLYNTEVNQSCPIKSWWELTTEKYKGKVMLKDPMLSSANMMFLVAITQHADAMAKDYEKVFGKKIALTTPNAGYEFIKCLVKNGLVLTKSDGDISKAVGTAGQKDPPIGMTAFDKMREVSQKGYKMTYAKGITPIEGMNSPTYLGIGTLSAHPNAAKLFIRWMMGDNKGGQGAVPFYETGCILGRADVPPPPATPTLAERNMWNPDVPSLLKDYQKVTDFWLSLQVNLGVPVSYLPSPFPLPSPQSRGRGGKGAWASEWPRPVFRLFIRKPLLGKRVRDICHQGDETKITEHFAQ